MHRVEIVQSARGAISAEGPVRSSQLAFSKKETAHCDMKDGSMLLIDSSI